MTRNRHVVGDGNSFCCAISLWNDSNNDHNHDKIRSEVNHIMVVFPDKFEPYLFQHRQKSGTKWRPSLRITRNNGARTA